MAQMAHILKLIYIRGVASIYKLGAGDPPDLPGDWPQPGADRHQHPAGGGRGHGERGGAVPGD